MVERREGAVGVKIIFFNYLLAYFGKEVYPYRVNDSSLFRSENSITPVFFSVFFFRAAAWRSFMRDSLFVKCGCIFLDRWAMSSSCRTARF